MGSPHDSPEQLLVDRKPIQKRRERSDDSQSPWIVTVNLDPVSHNFGLRWSVKGFEPLTASQREAVHRAAREIEQVANLKFQFVEHYEKKEKADIFLSQAILPSEDIMGRTNSAHTHDIVIKNGCPAESFNSGGFMYQTVLHELCHALGMGHPGGDGDNPHFSKNETIMSYNSHTSSNVSGFPSFHLRELDKRALRSLYGTSRVKQSVSSNESATVDFRGTKKVNPHSLSGDYCFLDLSASTLGKQVSDVITSSETLLRLDVIGNDLPNRLQGGVGESVLTARGGNDELTGRGGATYQFDELSGKNNIISNYDSKTDIIRVIPTFSSVDLVKLVLHSDRGEPKVHTNILMFDSKNQVAASALVLNATPEQVLTTVRYMSLSGRINIIEPNLNAEVQVLPRKNIDLRSPIQSNITVKSHDSNKLVGRNLP